MMRPPTARKPLKARQPPRGRKPATTKALQESQTTKDVRALIDRVRAAHGVRAPPAEKRGGRPAGAPNARKRPPSPPPPPPKPQQPPPPAPSAADLDAREREIAAEHEALERQMAQVRRQRAALTLQRRERELRDEAAATLSRRRAQLDARVERDVENLRRDLADREAALGRRRADIKREMDALVLKYEACATEACGAREAFQRAAESARAAAAEEASQYQRQADDAIRARLEREAKQLGFKMSASPRPRD
ncbi:unnamed protein product [Pelagomonas calceolata]|uniref:Uncharacterized protein n=1 Tax=Pelagomonas calceolata TaxID=35677 RepID=A0A7S4E673_9STRA|nr:unnamed protein product [Pelagomonas calceolata]